MKWTSIKLHLLPLIMQEIEVCEARYIDLINRIKAKKTKQLVDEFLEMRIDISKRIEELEDYFDENFGNVRMNILEKGIFQLKKLLFYNPDKNNDQEEADLPEFTGLVMDFNLIEKNVIKNQEFAKNLRQSNLKGPEAAKMRATMRATMRNNKQGNLKKSMRGQDNLGKSKTLREKEDETMGNNDNVPVEDDYQGKTVKKRLRIRLTDEEYRLLQKLKAKKKNAQQQQ
jgi:hypothetical protein